MKNNMNDIEKSLLYDFCIERIDKTECEGCQYLAFYEGNRHCSLFLVYMTERCDECIGIFGL